MATQKLVNDAFKEAQFHTHVHEKLSASVLSQFQNAKKSGKEDVITQFVNCMKYPMVEPKPEPAVERVINFISQTVAKAGGEDATLGFFEQVVLFLLKTHEANDKTVRYRTCQLLAKIISLIGDADIDDELCDQIFESMHTRLSDKQASIRVQAIKALSRLQDPSDKQCPIIKAFLFLMSCDPNWQVRIECLRCIAPTKRTMFAMIERTRDVNELIRRTAYFMIAEKISVKALSIAQRLSLLENGLADRSVAVQKICTDKLLNMWLHHYQGNILDLLSGLDIMSSNEVCEKSVNVILSKVSLDEILKEFDLLNEKKILDRERLSCESVFYYRVLLEYASKKGESAAEHMEQLTPDAVNFIDFITQLSQDIINAGGEQDEAGLERRAMNEYIVEQLISCIKYMDVSDPVARKSVLSLCKKLLNSDHISLSLVPYLMECIEGVLKRPTERIDEVASIMSDIQFELVVEDQQVDPEQLHQLKVKLAGVDMTLYELRELLSEAVSSQNFSTAAEIKEKISVLEVSKQALQEEMKPKPVVLPSQPRNDDTTKLKCLTIFVELLTSNDMTCMTDTIRSYMDELVIPAIPASCPATRNQAIKALGLCALCDPGVAKQYLPVLIQICQLDVEAVRVSALQALFDIILRFGDKFLNESTERRKSVAADAEKDLEDVENAESDEVNESSETETDSDSQVAAKSFNDLISLMVKYLDDESSEVRCLCAEGLARLLLSGRVSSHKLISRLIILWYNPVTEDDTKLRHCLGVFFPVFAFTSRANQQLVEEAFLPTLQILFDAPKSSPLTDIDEANVAELLVQLTDTRQLSSSNSKATESAAELTSHDSLAVKICNELLTRNSSYYGSNLLSKILTMLELSSDKILAKDLRTLVASLFETYTEGQVLKNLQKFEFKIEALSDGNVSIHQESTEVPGEEKSHSDNSEDEGHEEEQVIDRTVLDSTAAASKLKRNADRRAKKASVSAEQKDDSQQSDDSDRPINKTRRVVAPNLDEDSE